MSRKPTREQIVARARQAAVLADRGQLESAVAALFPVIEHAKDLPQVLDLYADIRGRQGHYTEAAEHYRQILKAHRDAVEVRQKLAMCLIRAARFDEAIQQIERIRETDEWNLVAVLALVEAYASLGMRDAALALLDELEANTDRASLDDQARGRVAVARMRLVNDTDLAQASLALASGDGTLTGVMRASLATHAGLIYQKAGRHDEAFEALAAAKRHRGLRFDADEHEARISRAIEYWSSDEARALPTLDTDGSRFVFIVGMPRSGTSLLEQMLGRVHGVAPLGERSEIVRLAAGICTPPSREHQPLMTETGRYTRENLDSVMPMILAAYDEAARRYAAEPDDRRFYIDKQTYNFNHLPLIARVLPGAKVIHIRRNPCDTALSCFSQWFNHQHHYTVDMVSLGAFYKQYRRLVEAYRSLPAPAQRPEMIDVVYEELVTEPERTIRPVLEFLGLEFDPAVLAPHEADRVVMTVSRDQVRSPINAGSVGRWTAYAAHMRPFIEAIGPELAAEAGA
ncbi:MAG: tetratricopeptide repeat-containing sulfotransferase family protein [Phycisphaerales bacterium]